jgi:hypothetical protein
VSRIAASYQRGGKKRIRGTCFVAQVQHPNYGHCLTFDLVVKKDHIHEGPRDLICIAGQLDSSN